ncbi:MAG: VPLPA-CTERM sorting domain-containing protein [Propionivibrio sp.]
MYRTLFFVVVLFHVLSGSATTMTFYALPRVYQEPTPEPKTYTENGITASAYGFLDLGYSGNVGTLHLDDSGTSIANTVTFSTGGPFTAVSFDLPPYAPSQLYYELYNPADSSFIEVHGIPYANVGVKGFRQGAVVAEDNFYSEDLSTYFFDTLVFADLDSLTISSQVPGVAEIDAIAADVLIEYPGYSVSSSGCFDRPCGHFNIDNLVLDSVAAVPLPGSLPMIALGLVALGVARRRLM